ncbi:MAG: dihydroorotase, partial [bacterium]
VLYKCGWSPLEGRMLRSQVVGTFVNGQEIVREGEFVGEASGQRLQFDR